MGIQKKSEEKQRKQKEILERTTKIDSFFTKSVPQPPIEEFEDNVPSTSKESSVLSALCEDEDATENHDEREEKKDQPILSLLSSQSFKFDKDPAKWIVNDELIDFVARNGYSQNADSDFQNSRRVYKDQTRLLSSTIFKRELQNGEVSNRQWIIYSETNGSIYCGPCRLLSKAGTSFCTDKGFNDWKNLKQCIEQHERSINHKNSVVALRARVSNKNLSNIQNAEIAQEKHYWTEVLQRVVVIVRKLTSRGLPLRGSDEVLGSCHNGNFLMAVELLAEFDPFLKEHLKNYGRPGSGKTNYLSSTTYEEVVHIMAQKCREVISANVRAAKYFSIIVDSTPDISHVDQLSIVMRYVQECGTPTEVFLTFVPNTGHKSEELYTAITNTLASLEINLDDCRGQSYDNAANMSGAYTGLQARIKNANKFAEFIPCSAHSVNLVGTSAASCCNESTNYFTFLQQIYNFFSASTMRWEKLKKNDVQITPKSLSSTRWSCRDDACKGLLKSWKDIHDTLKSISNDSSEKAITKAEAAGLIKRMTRFETAFMTVFWSSILNRINVVSKKLQQEDADIGLVIDLYKSLISFISSSRENFTIYEEEAKALIGKQNYTASEKRTRKRKRHFDETDESDDDEEVLFGAKDDFKINVFLTIVDRLISELDRRKCAYDRVFEIFYVLFKFRELSVGEIRSEALKLCEVYSQDISDDLVEEILHLKEYLALEDKKHVNINNMCNWIRDRNLLDIFPNIDIVLRIYKSMAVSNCSSERSFSCLKRIKTYLRSSMSESRLNDLAVLSIESDTANSISFDDVIKIFVENKFRRKV